jgi:hypothetical protein
MGKINLTIRSIEFFQSILDEYDIARNLSGGSDL